VPFVARVSLSTDDPSLSDSLAFILLLKEGHIDSNFTYTWVVERVADSHAALLSDLREIIQRLLHAKAELKDSFAAVEVVIQWECSASDALRAPLHIPRDIVSCMGIIPAALTITVLDQ